MANWKGDHWVGVANDHTAVELNGGEGSGGEMLNDAMVVGGHLSDEQLGGGGLEGCVDGMGEKAKPVDQDRSDT